MPRRPSRQTILVLSAFTESPGQWLHGYELSNQLGIASGTLYPILMRLHDRGVLETRWEESPIEGRPRRHMYRLTSSGRKWAGEIKTESAQPRTLNPAADAT